MASLNDLLDLITRRAEFEQKAAEDRHAALGINRYWGGTTSNASRAYDDAQREAKAKRIDERELQQNILAGQLEKAKLANPLYSLAPQDMEGIVKQQAADVHGEALSKALEVNAVANYRNALADKEEALTTDQYLKNKSSRQLYKDVLGLSPTQRILMLNGRQLPKEANPQVPAIPNYSTNENGVTTYRGQIAQPPITNPNSIVNPERPNFHYGNQGRLNPFTLGNSFNLNPNPAISNRDVESSIATTDANAEARRRKTQELFPGFEYSRF